MYMQQVFLEYVENKDIWRSTITIDDPIVSFYRLANAHVIDDFSD